MSEEELLKEFMVPQHLDDKWYHTAFYIIDYWIKSIENFFFKKLFKLLAVIILYLFIKYLSEQIKNSFLDKYSFYIIKNIDNKTIEIATLSPLLIVILLVLHILRIITKIIIYLNSSEFKAFLYWHGFIKTVYLPSPKVKIFIG